LAALVVDAQSDAGRRLLAEIGRPLQTASVARSLRFGPAVTPSGVVDISIGIEV
jgi:hypothetical protein